ncbi:hypothetical protein B0H15DRAFT_837435 [Mycena belliarum]|uniref:Uncharacterized protein n=1 Tax=Mycena belliarum TaxID=1033014 RepID=A0AAD6U4X1_9AGAR|nr:hypothetical protein B0H15DRAFT_837435 [Mycena belliae]
MSSSTTSSPLLESQTPQPLAVSQIERVVSPTPSAKKRFSALQRIKKLGGKLKKSKAEPIPEHPAEQNLPPVGEVVEQESAEEKQDTVVEELDISDPPEPATLAQRLRALITSLPKSGSEPPPIKSDPPPLDADGRPIPPPGAVRIKDPKLIELLSDPEFMNGPDGRVTVFEALDALDAPKYHKPTSSDDSPGEPDGQPGDDDVQSQGDVMMYAPLHPTDESEVQLAKSKIIEVPLTRLDTFRQSRWNFLWSVTVGLVKSQPPQTKLVQKWVPSTTKISFQAMWWGYRMYLPPPVLAALSEDEAEVVKIANTITAALTWFLSHVSAASVPPPLLPAFLLLQKLGPYAGYIGTFIAWIWGTVKNADQGLGVVLTATWVLPVALIPSAIKPATPPDTPATTPDTPPIQPPATEPPTTTPSGDPGPPVATPTSPDAEPIPAIPPPSL